LKGARLQAAPSPASKRTEALERLRVAAPAVQYQDRVRVDKARSGERMRRTAHAVGKGKNEGKSPEGAKERLLRMKFEKTARPRQLNDLPSG